MLIIFKYIIQRWYTYSQWSAANPQSFFCLVKWNSVPMTPRLPHQHRNTALPSKGTRDSLYGNQKWGAMAQNTGSGPQIPCSTVEVVSWDFTSSRTEKVSYHITEQVFSEWQQSGSVWGFQVPFDGVLSFQIGVSCGLLRIYFRDINR